jgi:predicted porin
MSENKKRSVTEIQLDYQNLCVKAGYLQYQVYTHQKDLDMVNKELRDLNLEAAASKAAEDASKVSAAALTSPVSEVEKEKGNE